MQFNKVLFYLSLLTVSGSLVGQQPAYSATDTLDLERQGPINQHFNLTDNIARDVDLKSGDLLSLDGKVYRDGNIRAGYYYYLPEAYHLGWSAATGEYEFNVTYGSATDGGPGKTTVTAVLYPTLRSQDLTVARELLVAKLAGKPEASFGVKDLIALPMTQAPEIEFTNLAQFGVSETDLSIRAPADPLDPILLSFTTDQIDALMAMFFNNIGLYGNVEIYPDGAGMPSVMKIPFNLKLDAPSTFGHFQLQGGDWRTEWRNPTDYPVRLGHLHVLRKEGANYRVYSWKADEALVPEGAKVEFSSETVPRWIDTDPNVERMWLDYSITDCESCTRAVKKKILGSIGGQDVAKPEKLEFTILTPMAYTGASLIRINLRSYQASASGNQLQELPSITVNADGEVLSGGTLYVRDGRVDFEYKIKVYLEDGTNYESAWLPSNSKEVVIGSRQIADSIAEFSGR